MAKKSGCPKFLLGFCTFIYDLVVHNGIITNYKDIKQFLMTKGFRFESDTDTEAIAKLLAHLANENPRSSFRQLVEQTIQQLEGAFACVFKSSLFPGECVATRRGSPMVVGIKSGQKIFLVNNLLYLKNIRQRRLLG